MEETRISAEEVRPGMVLWLGAHQATCLIVRVSRVRKREWNGPKIEITSFLVEETSVAVDTFTYDPWELFLSGAVLLRGSR